MIARQKGPEARVDSLITRAAGARIQLDRIWVRQGGEWQWEGNEKERLYLFLDARGVFSVGALGTRWKAELHPNTVVWVPAGVEHTVRNCGDAVLRVVVFTGVPADAHKGSAKLVGESPQFQELSNIEKRSMVSFLTRTLLAPEPSPTRVFVLSEYQTVLPGGWIPDHVHEGREEVCYVCSGAGTLQLEGEAKSVVAGEAARVPPGTWHSMKNEQDDLLEYVLVQAQRSSANRDHGQQEEGQHETTQSTGRISKSSTQRE